MATLGQSYGKHEIPLFSAIQDRLNGMHVVPVDSEEMVREVEEFITAKLEAGWKAKRDHIGPNLMRLSRSAFESY